MVGQYFEGTYDVISVTTATRQVNKRPSKLQLLKIIGKTKSVTYRFYFFVGKLPKFFKLLESMTKSYLVEFKIHQKIVLDRFPRNFFM